MAPADPNGGTLSPEIEKLAAQLAKDPRSRAFIPLAEEYVKAGLLQEAATVLEEGLKVYPSFVTALVALGRVYVQLQNSGKARQMLEEAVKLSPDNLLAHRMLARIYVTESSWDAARRSCEAVLFGFPKDEEMLALKQEIDARRQSGTGSSQPPGSVPTEPAPVPGELGAAVGERPSDTLAQAPEPQSAGAGSSDAPDGQAGAPPAAGQKVLRLQKLLEKIQARRAS